VPDPDWRFAPATDGPVTYCRHISLILEFFTGNGIGGHVRSILWSAGFAIFVGILAEVAAAGSLERSLMKLDPEERAHQACVAKGLDVVRRDKRLSRADRLMPATFKRARFEGNVVSAKGGAVRSNAHWYAISFECTVSDDQMKAVAFTFELGDEIPPDTWDDVGLWR
jgi:hypothetical protein